MTEEIFAICYFNRLGLSASWRIRELELDSSSVILFMISLITANIRD